MSVRGSVGPGALVVAIGLILATPACGDSEQTADQPPETVATIPVTTETSQLESVPANSAGTTVPAGTTVYYPPTPAPGTGVESDIVVLVPGGGWESADPGGLVPLAESLAAGGAVVATVIHRTSADAVYFPEPVEDVACAISTVVQAVGDAGYTPGRVVAAGHSSGAQLAALVALRPDVFAGDCEAPAAAPDLLVGLSGPYDVVRAAPVAINLFGPENADPEGWSDGNPVDHAAARPDVAVLLIHGDSDRVVPRSFSVQFETALLEGGHRVEAIYPPEVDHHSAYAAEVAGPLILEWLGLEIPSS